MGLEDFLRMVMQRVKRDMMARRVKRGAGDPRLYPLHLLCEHLITGLRDVSDAGLGSEILAIIMIMLQESMDGCNAGLQTYVNILPEHDPLPYPVKLLCP